MDRGISSITDFHEDYRFVELECLTQTCEGYYEWKERSRWIKLEEDIETGSGRWCKPYVPSLPYKAIIKLRQLLQDGDLLLDINEKTLEGVADQLCESLSKTNVLSHNSSFIFHAVLLARHHHRHRHHSKRHGFHLSHEDKPALLHLNLEPIVSGISLKTEEATTSAVVISLLEDNESDASSVNRSSSITRFMTEQSEATTILVAEVPYASKPSLVFARLRKGEVLGNLNEVQVPVRFVILVIGPPNASIDYYQVGRAIGILMSDKTFGKLASICRNTTDFLDGIDQYLIRSTIVPEGKWDSKIWNQSINKWNSLVTPNPVLFHHRKSRSNESFDRKLENGNNKADDDEELERIGTPFGGLISDVKRKIRFYPSDFTDSLNLKCLLSAIVVWVSFLAPTITFGALLSKETNQLLGLAEICYATALGGLIFGLFGGQPLLILGATGPIYVMEGSIYKLSTNLDVEFLSWRAWIGLWITFLFVLIVALDLSYLIKYITSGIEEIITALISTVFIYESIEFIYATFHNCYFHLLPVSSTYPTNISTNATANGRNVTDIHQHSSAPDRRYALASMSIILMFGTYYSCHFIRKIRYTRFFSVYFRRLISDFGILITIVIFLLFDIWMVDDYTPKLNISDRFTLTSPSRRGWIINLMGESKKVTIGYIMLAIIPAFLVTIVLFIETEVTGAIMDRREHKLKKGSGYRLDLFITGLVIALCSVLGLPWMCVCQVHSTLHLNSLSVLSKNHAPGTRAHIIRVIEQRVTNIAIHILIGLSLFLKPVLRLIPLAVPFGVFLYLGVTSLSYLQLIERVKLMMIPAKRHPNYRYLRKVKIKKVHLFTIIQVICLLGVLAVKNSIIAPSFPFFILLLIPLRTLMKKVFTEEELEELDGVEEKNMADDLDEYDVVPVKT